MLWLRHLFDMKSLQLSLFAVSLCGASLVACSSSSSTSAVHPDAAGANFDAATQSSGGTNASGGKGGATGGSVATGGTTRGAGGIVASTGGTGGANSLNGGASGAVATGGTTGGTGGKTSDTGGTSGISTGGTAGGTGGKAGATGGSAGSPSGTGGATSTGGSMASGGAGTGGSTASAGGSGGTCGDGDSNLPAEPTIPPACTTLLATQAVAAGALPSETSLDTSAIQKALDGCASGQAVKLTISGANNAFITGPLTLPAGVTLWVDAGTTLYATRDPKVWGSASELISVTGANSGIVGDGIINGQGGEPNIGSTQSWWDQNAGSSGNSPALIAVRGATRFTLYRITLHDSPKFHVKMGAAGFVAWGVTIKAPSKATNSAGTALNYTNA